MLVLAIYLDNVVPNLGGQAKPLLFFLNKNYWLGIHK